ncbi:MAG: LTA synthase family protein [Flavobacteriales bacterium]|nr:LTA synthase family protein [Flavobacteriales bacterium]
MIKLFFKRCFTELFFWLGLFILLQLTFLIFFSSELSRVDGGAIALGFVKGFAMNFSSACYLSTIPVLLIGLKHLRGIETKNVHKVYGLIFLLILMIIHIADFSLYQNWGSKINGRALWYLQFPEAVANSAASSSLVKYMIGLLLVFFIAWRVYSNLNKPLTGIKNKFNKFVFSGILILSTGLLFIGLRGGISGRPLGKSSSYYSVHPVLNSAALNGFWNFFDVVSHYKDQGNPYDFFSETELSALTKKYSQPTTSVPYLTQTGSKPNIVFVFLESWTADVVSSIGGLRKITPGFDHLAQDGLLFTNFYSTGFRTEQGLMATLSGFPAQAKAYPMEEMERFENYPNLITRLSKNGYYTSYFTGGNPEFANTKTYLTSAGIDLVDGQLLQHAKKRSAWGALDEETFDYVLNKLDNQSQPFFSIAVTLTSHEWYDAPVRKIFNGGDPVAANYKNTVHYTDSCLLDFIGKAKTKPWYRNSIIIVMADHGNTYPLSRQIHEKARYRIPCLILGGALKKELKGRVEDNYMGHLSIPSIILNEVSIPRHSFILSPDPFITDQGKAYYVYDHGFGVLGNKGYVIYDLNANKILEKSTNDSTEIKNMINYGRFMLQKSASLKAEYQVLKKEKPDL